MVIQARGTLHSSQPENLSDRRFTDHAKNFFPVQFLLCV